MLTPDFEHLPRRTVTIDATADQGPLELWRHTVGVGGINSTPLPPHVVQAAASLRPRLIRIFIQEFFNVCPTTGQPDWSRLDPYMDALAATGAKIVAAVTIKPPPFFSAIDQTIWQPTDLPAYQKLLHELAYRYSVQRPLVTHWEIGNEPDIGEWGGCPYLIKDPRTYGDYYRMTIAPILQAFPAAKVGGPALANADATYVNTFASYCQEHKLPLHFVTWHLYHDDPQQHAAIVHRIRQVLTAFPAPRPELMVTEWAKGFDPVSVEELAFHPRRAAITAASILAMMQAGLDWSFYYHLWDQTAYTDQFRPFFANPRIMTEHWNEIPHRFGLFGVNGEVRPQYFVYWMLTRLGDRMLGSESDDRSLHVLPAARPGQVATIIVNLDRQQSRDLLATVRFNNLTPGRKRLQVHRIDATRRWSANPPQLLPAETREVDTEPSFRCQLYCPADTVALLTLEDMA
jgi:hypothetical protein